MRIFIASSGERLNMAIEVGSWLEGMNVEPVLWNEPEVIIPGISEPPARTLRATVPENERHIFR